MTDYGRSQGSEPWYPQAPPPASPDFGQEGPIGDQWADPYQQQHQHQNQHNQQYQQGYDQNGWDPYAARHQQYYPQEQYDAWGNPVAYGQGDQYGHGDGQGNGQSNNGQSNQYGGEQGQQPPHEPYPPQQAGPGHHAEEPYEQGPYEQGPYEQDSYEQDSNGWRPYERQPEEQPGAQRTDRAPDPDPDPEAPAADDHPFFSNGFDGFDEEDDTGRSSRRRGRGEGGRGGKPRSKSKSGKKRHSGCACLVVVLVIGGGAGGVGWYGYRFLQERLAPAPDYSGQGSGEVQVEIPDGSTLTEMANILKKSSVVKSVDAFNEAARKNRRSIKIQGGFYLLHKEMSAAAAITMMLDPKAQSVLIVTEGMRDAQVYKAIDRKLRIAPGTTKKVAAAQADKLGLPSWADDSSEIKDPLEGFLYPSRYSVGKNTRPADLLRQMVRRASAQYAQDDVAAEAKKYGLKSPLQVVTVASLVQAEGKTDEDFRKMARVVYNRLKVGNYETNGFLEFDSTYNYITNQSKIDLSVSALRSFNNPYNTYFVKGLPPGPIGNPGQEALQAAMNPASGNWYYFVSVDGQKTQFTETLAEHDRLVQEFNEKQRNGS